MLQPQDVCTHSARCFKPPFQESRPFLYKPEVYVSTASHVHTLFQNIDRNKDGTITLDEYSLYLKSIRLDADPTAPFQKADVNGDGRLKKDELDKLMLEWWVSDDPHAPGNCFFTGTVT